MKSVTSKVLTTTLLVVISLAAGLMLVMTYFMSSLTDTIMLNVMQPMAKTAAQSVEGNLHTLAERFYLIRDNSALSSPETSVQEKREVLEKATSGIEFVWLGLYEPDGSLLTGGNACPRNITGRPLYSLLRNTENMAIEDTAIGTSGLEIVMGVPVLAASENGGSRVAYYLVGSYKYDVLGDVLRNINIGISGAAFVINERGLLIAHKDLGKVFSQEPVTDSLGSNAAVEEILVLMKQGQTGSADIYASDGQTFVSFSPIRGTLWSLGIQAPKSDFTSPTRQAFWFSAFTTLLAFAFFAVVLGVIARKILAVPLNSITESARELSMGIFENKLPAKITGRSDEIGRLGSAFVSMSNSIRGAIQDIRQLSRAARAGSLEQRVDPAAYHGDYRLILAGMNATLDVFCSYLDSMPGALMLFSSPQEPIYCNQAMSHILERHGLRMDAALLATLVSSGTSDVLAPEAVRIFEEADDMIFKADVSVNAVGNTVRNYSLSLGRVGSGTFTHMSSEEEVVCVMLILNDVTMLTRARVDAEAASRAKSDFLSRMSHEMRTPMNAIIGMAAIGKSSEEIQRKEYSLERISEASQHLLGVINDILDMSKIEAGKFELSYVEFDLEKMLQRVTNVINFRVEEKAQNLLVVLDRKLPRFIVSDEQRLAQVITNLLSNAVKFTPEEGSITLKVDVTDESENACGIRFSVKDTGIGISEEQQRKLFTVFEQADGSISRKYGGTGLGLAISKRIIEMMEGRIWVESELGNGTAFLFEIGVSKGEGEPHNTLPPEIDWDNLRVLVVDDAPDILEQFKEIFAPYGVLCETASNGREAIALVKENVRNPFDLIFVDWRMPEMDGIELSQAIMSISSVKPTIILITAAEWSGIEQSARQAGISAFLQKPVFPSLLVDRINECTTHQQKLLPVTAEKTATDGVLEGKRILLAEDVEINREIVLALIEHTGIAIDFAEDGEEAVGTFVQAPQGYYDLILMDVHMPKVDGYEATRRIRASGVPGADIVPIIAMTANVFREDVERCLASGMNSHLGKPIDADEVITTLRRFLA